MKAVILAGGSGTRLRPLTCDLPKPMVPFLDHTVLYYGFSLLKQHGVDQIALTLMYQPRQIEEYVSSLAETEKLTVRCFVEETPLGTAGSVKNAEEFLDDRFIVLSGDAVTDLDITEAVRFHEQSGALVTLVLKRSKHPLEYGVVNVGEDGRILSFLEKPGWSELTDSTVNTGIYICEKEVLSYIEQGKSFDFSKDLFPKLLTLGLPVYGFITEDYWCDVGDCFDYFDAQRAALGGEIKSIAVPESGIYTGSNVVIEEDVKLNPPVWIGSGSVIRSGSEIGPNTIIGANCELRACSAENSVLWDGCVAEQGSELRQALLCGGCRIGRHAAVHERAVLGKNCKLGPFASVEADVRLWPGCVVPGEEHVREDMHFCRGSGMKLPCDGLCGELGVDLELGDLQRLACAVAAQYPSVLVGSDTTARARAAAQFMAASAALCGANVTLSAAGSLAQARFGIMHCGAEAGVYVSEGEQLQFRLLDSFSTPMDTAARKRLCRTQAPDCRRMGSLEARDFRQEYMSSLVQSLSNRSSGGAVVFGGSREAREEAVGIAGILGYRASEAEKDMGQAVRESGAAVGAVLNQAGAVVRLFNEQGEAVSHEQFLYLRTLLCAQMGAETAYLPCSASAECEQKARQSGLKILRSDTPRPALLSRRDAQTAPLYYDGMFLTLYLAKYLSSRRLYLSRITPELPVSAVAFVPCPDSEKGGAMRAARNSESCKAGRAFVVPGDGQAVLKIYASAFNEEYAREIAVELARELKEAIEKRED